MIYHFSHANIIFYVAYGDSPWKNIEIDSFIPGSAYPLSDPADGGGEIIHKQVLYLIQLRYLFMRYDKNKF